METGSTAERVREIAERIALDNGLELVNVEVAGAVKTPILRVFIDKPPSGVTHEDCAAMSHHLGAILDVEDFISSAYTLEVSSPGIERGLFKLAEYERFAGQAAKLKTREAIDGQRNFRGRIVGTDGELVIFDDRTNGRALIPFRLIVKANLEIDLEEELRQAKHGDQAQSNGHSGDGGNSNGNDVASLSDDTAETAD